MTESSHSIYERQSLQFMIELSERLGIPSMDLRITGLQLGYEHLDRIGKQIGEVALQAINLNSVRPLSLLASFV